MLKDLWMRYLLASEIVFPEGFDFGRCWIFGGVVAMILSWTANKSVMMMIFHALTSWLYVLYYVLVN